MKNIYRSLRVFITVFSILIFQQELLANYKGDDGIFDLTVIDQDAEGIKLKLTIEPSYLQFYSLFIQNQTFPEIFPIFSGYLALPEDSKVSFTIDNTTVEEFDQLPGTEFTNYAERDLVSLSTPVYIRGLRATVLNISPFYLDKTNEILSVCSEIILTIKFTGGNSNFVDGRLRNLWWEPLFANLLINYESLSTFKLRNPIGKETGAEYLIISPNADIFKQWADSIKIFRTRQGILSRVVTLDDIGGNTVSQIENYIDEAYNTWDIPPVAILLLGDHGIDAELTIPAPVWDNYCVSDNIYADVNNDNLPDIIPARICAQSADQLEIMVNKVLNFELNPPNDTSFYARPITSCYFQEAGTSQVVTESLAGYFEEISGKSAQRINVAPNPLPPAWTISPMGITMVTFFQNLGYLPSTPAGVNSTWNGSTQNFIDGINEGSFMIIYDGYGSETGWSEPSFTINDLGALSNINPAFIWSLASVTGKFNWSSNCFAEEIHRNNFGALGVIAPSEVNYSQTTDIYAFGALDQLWDDYLPDVGNPSPTGGIFPAMASVAGKYYLQQSPWVINPNQKKLAYHLFHFFGDAFTTLFSELPQEAVVVHDPYIIEGETTFSVTANVGALVALSVEDELIGVGPGTGNPSDIPIIPQYAPGEVSLTVTQRNHNRYHAALPVVLEEGVSESKLESIHIYPIPSKDDILVSFGSGEKSRQIAIIIYNSAGREVLRHSLVPNTTDVFTLKTRNFNPGIYYISLFTDSETRTEKIVIY